MISINEKQKQLSLQPVTMTDLVIFPKWRQHSSRQIKDLAEI